MIRVNGDPVAWHEGMSVADLLEQMKFKFPMLIVTLGEEHIPKAAYAETPVPDGTEVKVMHLLSGG